MFHPEQSLLIFKFINKQTARVMKKILVFTSITFSLISCKEGWTEQHRSDYLRTCMEDVGRSTFTDTADAAAYCHCSLEAIMKRYQTIAELIVNRDSTALRADLQNCHDKVAAHE